MAAEQTFSILISTKNRKEELAYTLQQLADKINAETQVVVYDDGSDDGTFDYVQTHFPWVVLHKNEKSCGYLYCRNKMLNQTKSEFAISLDDDANFLTDNPLEKIKEHFAANPECGLVAMRIFWGTDKPHSFISNENTERVKSFVGCAHAWRMQTWKQTPDYPEWFVFYGEEDFASYQLFKKGIEIHYLPEVLVHHRVDVAARKKNTDYSLRLRRALRSGWYLFFLFYPLYKVPRIMAYSIWIQLKFKVFRGDFMALKALLLAIADLFISFPRIIRQSNRLTKKEYDQYQQLAATKIYWNPETKPR